MEALLRFAMDSHQELKRYFVSALPLLRMVNQMGLWKLFADTFCYRPGKSTLVQVHSIDPCGLHKGPNGVTYVSERFNKDEYSKINLINRYDDPR